MQLNYTCQSLRHKSSRPNRQYKHLALREDVGAPSRAKPSKYEATQKKKQAHEVNLKVSINLLRKEHQKLELRIQLLRYNIATKTTSWGVVSEYFRLLGHAFKSADNECNLDVHRAFLQATMAPDLLTETGCGIEALLKEHKRLSLYHPDTEVQLVHLDNSSHDVVHATVRVKVSIGLNTPQHAFPHFGE
ncbi:unnamed protein product [Phytophthora lilii]|uniref:Unnamed protein product n=1 Tax=Phytophthora lilii TaxID=2077276 RepID=A0A9W7D9I5_9STRA|nr:unnamed protein product [Phytophthora lilii]